MRKALALAALSLACAGCNGNILGYDQRQMLAAPPAAYTGSIPNPWYLYKEGLLFGDWLKGLDFYAGGTFVGTPVIELNHKVNPYSAPDCMRLGIGAQTGGWWCGMILLQNTGFAASNAAPGVDISAGNFTKCVFRARLASGSSPVNFQAFNDGANTISPVVTSAWQEFTIPLTNPANIATMRQFFVIGMSSGMGTVTPIDVFIDDLRFEQ
jgi:hypothetical protein